MTRQECFELLDDVDCISATLNTLADESTGFKFLNEEYVPRNISVIKYGPLVRAFAWSVSEEGHEHWLNLDDKLYDLCAKK